MKRLLIIIVIGLVGFSACYTTRALSPKAQMVKEADEKMVTGCQYLGEVYGADQWGFQLTRNAKINYSMKVAREQALSLGATHIVWKTINTGLIPSATGRAYKCGK